MEEQRTRARASTGRGGRDEDRERARVFADAAGFDTTFTGYETVEQTTAVGAVDRQNGRLLVKLVESPFYATGGGQVHDAGEVRCESGDCAASVTDVLRLGDDQVLVLEPVAGELHEGERVVALVDRAARRATECNHTATHLLHAALRERLGTHVRQAGSYVGPDKLRFDFTHGAPLAAEDVAWVEDRVNEWILANQPVRALTTTLDEARGLGAMALFGEKYGDVVRMVEVGDGAWSRELCGGTHVRSTAEIGAFKLTTETSSAANVRRIEAITGPVAIERPAPQRPHPRRGRPRPAHPAAPGRRGRRRARGQAPRAREDARGAGRRRLRRGARRRRREGRRRDEGRRQPEAARGDRGPHQGQARRPLGDRARHARRGAGQPARRRHAGGDRPRRAGGGDRQDRRRRSWAAGGGGRDNMAQAGGRDPDKLPDALKSAEQAIRQVLA